MFEKVDDRDAILHVTRSLGWTYEQLGDREHARTLYAANLAQARAIDNTYIVSASTGVLAMFAADEGRLDEARALAREHIPGARDFGKLELSAALSRAAYVLAHTGDPKAAASVLACANAIADEIGAAWNWLRDANAKTIELARAHLGEQAFFDASPSDACSHSTKLFRSHWRRSADGQTPVAERPCTSGQERDRDACIGPCVNGAYSSKRGINPAPEKGYRRCSAIVLLLADVADAQPGAGPDNPHPSQSV